MSLQWHHSFSALTLYQPSKRQRIVFCFSRVTLTKSLSCLHKAFLYLLVSFPHNNTFHWCQCTHRENFSAIKAKLNICTALIVMIGKRIPLPSSHYYFEVNIVLELVAGYSASYVKCNYENAPGRKRCPCRARQRIITSNHHH